MTARWRTRAAQAAVALFVAQIPLSACAASYSIGASSASDRRSEVIGFGHGGKTFDAEDLRLLKRRFQLEQGPTPIAIYPGARPRPCWMGKNRPAISELFKTEMALGRTAMPIGCLFAGYRADELHNLANTGDQKARFIYRVLLIEMNGCSDVDGVFDLERMSTNGFAPASISLGNFLFRCGRKAAAIERYRLAEMQGYINARSYYRGKEIELNPPKN